MLRSHAEFADLNSVLAKAADLAVGCLLILAAVLKFASPGESAALRIVYEVPQAVIIAAIQVELVLGLLLIVGYRPKLVWRTTGLLFVLFALVTFYRATAGYESCGCFGAIRVNPWFSFVLDLVILGIAYVRQRQTVETPQTVNRWQGFVVFSVAAISLCISTTWYHWSAPRTIASGPIDAELTAADIVVLEPDRWNEFPLGHVLTPPQDLSSGTWTVVFFHHDCPVCQEVLPLYQQLASNGSESLGTSQLLLVEVPPFADDFIHEGAGRFARLPENVEWFVQTPTVVNVCEGKVTQVSHESPRFTSWRPHE